LNMWWFIFCSHGKYQFQSLVKMV